MTTKKDMVLDGDDDDDDHHDEGEDEDGTMVMLLRVCEPGGVVDDDRHDNEHSTMMKSGRSWCPECALLFHRPTRTPGSSVIATIQGILIVLGLPKRRLSRRTISAAIDEHH